MRYYVLSDDGQKYGPADVPTLNQWIAENRLLPTQMLEEEGSGARLAARAVPGLNFPVVSEPGSPAGPAGVPGQPHQGYYRPPGGVTAGEDGSRDITPAWVLFAVGLLPCICFPYVTIPLAGVSIYFANKAKQKGHPQGALVFGLGVGLVILAVLWLIAAFSLRGWAESMQRTR